MVRTISQRAPAPARDQPVPHSSERRPGREESAGLEGHRALLDLADRAQQDRRGQRDESAHATPGTALGVEARARWASAIWPARSTMAGTARTEALTTNASPRAHAAAFEIDNQRADGGGEVDRASAPVIATSRTRVSIAKARPSAWR